MFNLFRSRDKSVRYLLSALLGIVALSMVTYLVPGSGTGSGSASDSIVAEIGREDLTVREVQQALQASLRNRQMPPGMMGHYVPQLIDQLITEKAVTYQAERMGFDVSDADTANAIRQQMPQLFQDGTFIGNETYAAVLQQQGLSIADFERYMNRQILLNRLRGLVLEATVISPPEIEQEYRRRNEKASVEYVKVAREKLAPQVPVSPEEMQEYFNRSRANYKIPEKRSLLLLVLDPAKLEQTVTVTDEQLRRAYEQNKDRFRTPERVKARHILFSTVDKKPEEVTKIQAKAEDLLKQIKAGGDFAELAKKNSEDPTSAPKGGDLDWVERGRTVPEFETAAFALKAGETSGIIKTQYGLHIIQAQAKEQARLKPLEEVKAELTAEIRRESVTTKLQSTIDQAISEVKKNPAEAEQVARKYGLSTAAVGKVGAGDPIPEIGVNREYYESISSLNKGEVTSQPFQAPGNKLIVTVATEVHPAHPAEFEEVKDQVRNALVLERTGKLVIEKANELMEKVKAAGGDLSKAAKSMGLEVVKSPEFSRVGAIEGLGSADVMPEVFTKPVGTLLGPIALGTDRVVAKVASHTPANLAELASQRAAIHDELKRQKARERNALEIGRASCRERVSRCV